MQKRKLRDIPGVGGVQEQILSGIGIKSCSDILKRACELYVCVSEH